jgi:uncharacterized membrane protein
MSNVESVRVFDREMSHWKITGPAGTNVEFDAKTTEMSPERGIGWVSEGEVDNSGQVRFEEIAQGRTRVDVTLDYGDPPGGKVGELAAQVVQNPEKQIREDLENFAMRVERGELDLRGPSGPGGPGRP